MNPRHGEVWLADLGMAAKTRPVIVLMADDIEVPRTLIIYVPITRQSRGSQLEIPINLPFLEPGSVANVQGIGALPRVRFERRLGVILHVNLAAIKNALIRACSLTM